MLAWAQLLYYTISHWWERTKLPAGRQRNELWTRQKEWRRRWYTNEPIPFPFVSEEYGIPVGDPIEVFHLTLHDMMEHAVATHLTNAVLLEEKLKINAVRKISFRRTGDYSGVTTIQPVHIPELGVVTDPLALREMHFTFWQRSLRQPEANDGPRHFIGRGGTIA